MLIPRTRGFTLIELIIGLAIIAGLLATGVPAFGSWIRNTHNRTAAESVSNGLQLARVEAVRRNAPVRFTLTDATGAVSWSVGCVVVTTDCPDPIQQRGAAEGNGNARAGARVAALPSPITAAYFSTAIAAGSNLPAGVTFNGLGRIPTANAATDIKRIDVTTADATDGKRYVVTIGAAGLIRMCDPLLTFPANPQGCN